MSGITIRDKLFKSLPLLRIRAFPNGTSKSSGTTQAASNELYRALGSRNRKTFRSHAGTEQSGGIIGKRRIYDTGTGQSRQGSFQFCDGRYHLRYILPKPDVKLHSEQTVRYSASSRTFYILFNCRPEIISKFGSFNHNTYFGIEAAVPLAVPTIKSSAIGALKTREIPNSCCIP